MNSGKTGLADRAFQGHAQERLGLHRELHRQLLEDVLAEAVDDHAHRVLLGDTAALAVEELVLADLGGGRLVLHGGGAVADLLVGEGVGTALVADQQGVALGEVARPLGPRADLHQAPVGLVAAPGGDALGDDAGAGALADMDHLGAGIGLLAAVGHGHGVELADALLAAQHAGRVLPGDGGAGLDLGPADAGAVAAPQNPQR